MPQLSTLPWHGYNAVHYIEHNICARRCRTPFTNWNPDGLPAALQGSGALQGAPVQFVSVAWSFRNIPPWRTMRNSACGTCLWHYSRLPWLRAHWFDKKGEFIKNFAKNRARTFKTIEPVDPDVFSICYWFEAPWTNIQEVLYKIAF